MRFQLPGLRTFNSFAQFANHLTVRERVIVNELRGSLHVVTKAIQETAQDELGTYQGDIGPFAAWQQLADDTMAHHIQVIVDGDAAPDAGENTPLLLTGKLRESVKREVKGLDGYVGSELDEAVYMELGTDKSPPRAFLGPAVYHNEELIRDELGAALVRGLLDPTLAPLTQITERVI